MLARSRERIYAVEEAVKLVKGFSSGANSTRPSRSP